MLSNIAKNTINFEMLNLHPIVLKIGQYIEQKKVKNGILPQFCCVFEENIGFNIGQIAGNFSYFPTFNICIFVNDQIEK